MELEPREASYSQAFRRARESGADYFLIISVTENERDIAITGELFVGRTGTPAATFSAYRTGSDRLRNAARGIVDAFAAALPFRGQLLQYNAGTGLIDKGRLDGVKAGTVYDVVRTGALTTRNEGIGFSYGPEDIVGTLVIATADEEVSAGSVTRNGFFDRISVGDEIIPQVQSDAPAESTPAADPELRTLLRGLR
jgi:hypothetical protein